MKPYINHQGVATTKVEDADKVIPSEPPAHQVAYFTDIFDAMAVNLAALRAAAPTIVPVDAGGDRDDEARRVAAVQEATNVQEAIIQEDIPLCPLCLRHPVSRRRIGRIGLSVTCATAGCGAAGITYPIDEWMALVVGFNTPRPTMEPDIAGNIAGRTVDMTPVAANYDDMARQVADMAALVHAINTGDAIGIEPPEHETPF